MKNCFHTLICPICRAPLQQIDRALKCTANHTFDFAREGYVNLLPSRKKLAATVGDNPEMLQARRRFLNGKHYAMLSNALNQQVAQLISTHHHTSDPLNILDAGCGEGYYLGQLQSHLQATTPQTSCCFLGMDVSKTAVRYAAKFYKNGRFFVSNINTLIPAADQSINILLNIFAPRNPAEFARIMAPNSHLLIVIPKQNHLQTVREKFGLLEIEADKQESVVARLANHFQLNQVTTLAEIVTLTQQPLIDLLKMTPNAHHLTKSDWDEVNHTETITTRISFDLMHFKLY